MAAARGNHHNRREGKSSNSEVRINVKCTEHERKRWKAMAARRKLDLSDLVRTVLEREYAVDRAARTGEGND